MKYPQMFSIEVNLAAREHAIAEYPNESVGFVVEDTYVPLKNMHDEPDKYFRIDPQEIVKLSEANKTLQAIIHSHPDVTILEPSFSDQELQLSYNIPCGLIQTKKDNVEDKVLASNVLWWGTGVEIPPLVGRPFITGIYDCSQIVIDYYKTVLNIDIGNHARDLGWWDKAKGEENWNMIEDMYPKFGFKKINVKDIQPHDVVVMSILSKTGVANHCAVYTGGDNIIHHMPGLNGRESLSRNAVLSEWMPYVKFAARHKKVKKK